MLLHYSAKPLEFPIRSVAQIARPDHKPRGFWVSVEGVGDSWKDWCEGEEWNVERLAFSHEIVLRPDANILRLSTAENIDWLTKEFVAPGAPPWAYYQIDWARVAAKWDGIIIAPYVHERRLHHETNWYYTWDCASGCIWNARAIEQESMKVES